MLKIQRDIINKLETITDIAERTLDNLEAIYSGECKSEDYADQAKREFENYYTGEIQHLCSEAYQMYINYENVKEQFKEE